MNNNSISTNRLCGTRYPEECIYRLPCGTCLMLKEQCKMLNNAVIPNIAQPNWLYEPSWTQITPEACKYCPNHPNNGGSGNCNCTLGSYKITC